MNDYLLWGALAGVAGLLVVWLAIRRKPKGFHRQQQAEPVASVQSTTGGPPSIDTVSAAYRVQAPIVDSKPPAPRLPGEDAREAAEAAAREAADREAAEWEAQLQAQHEAQETARRAEQAAAAMSPPTLTNAVSAPEFEPLRLQTEEELQAVMDREAAEFAARIEAERLASEAPTLQPSYAADELRLQDESTPAAALPAAPTLTDVVTEIGGQAAAPAVDEALPAPVAAEDSAAARREAAAQLARERAEREAAEAEAWLDEQRRATEARRAQAAIEAVGTAPETAGDAIEAPPSAAAEDIAAETATAAEPSAFDFQIEVPRLPTEAERYAQIERETAELAARVQAQRLAIDQLGVVPSLGIELEFPAVPDAADVSASSASVDPPAFAPARVDDDFPPVELEFAAPEIALEASSAPAMAEALPTLEPMAIGTPPQVDAAPAPRTPDQFVVMVADDSKVVRVKTSRLLLKQGYQVLLAEDGLDAVRQIALRVPDVLITDVEMPGLDGFGLTRQVRTDARSAQIPIVMITADDEKHRAAANEAGVSVLLSKPYPEDRLLSYLEEALGCVATASV